MLETTSSLSVLPAREMRSSRFKISVILPTLNEVENICDLIDQIYAHVPHLHEVLVVDDDSSDGTAEAVAAYAKRFPDRRIRADKRLQDHGLTRSLWHGIRHVSGDVVVWMDCDFSMPPEVIPSLLLCIEDGYDIAVGSRFVRGGSFKRNTANTSDSAIAVFLSRCMNYTIQLLLDHSFKDYTSGFVAARRKIFDEIELRGDYGEYFIDFIFRAIRRGLHIIEVPYVCLPRLKGVSKTGESFGRFCRLGWRYLEVTARLRFLASFTKSLPLRPARALSDESQTVDAANIKIVAAESAHIPLVAGLHRRVLYQTLNSRLGIPFLEDLYSGVLLDPNAKIWVALQSDRLLGFVALTSDLKATKKLISRQLLWRDRLIALFHVLTSFRDFKEFISHELFFRYCLLKQNPFPTILTLGVVPYAQGSPVALRLMNHAHDSYREFGIRNYYVDTYSNNMRAIAFYQKVGFRRLTDFAFCINAGFMAPSP